MSKRFLIAAILLALCAFMIPIEHKYDKPFRHYSLTLIPQGLEISKQYDKKIYFYISDLIALVLFFMGLSVRRFFSNPLWIVWLCALISIIASPFFNYPIAYFRLLQLFTPIVLFSFITNTFSEEEKSKITRILLIAIVSAGLLQTGIGIVQYFHQGPLGLRLFGEVGEKSIFTIRDGSRWLIDQWTRRQAASPVIMRASGTFANSNVFGGFMFFSILATYALAMQSKRRLLLWTLPFQLFALCLSYSRSALFAWGLASLIWFALMVYQRGFKCRKLWEIAAALAFSFSLLACLLYTQYFYRGGVVSYTNLAKDADNIRKFHQNLGIAILYDHPLLGVGFSQFTERSGPYFPENTRIYVRSTAPHNMFLFLACETGLVSALVLIFWIASIYWKFLQSAITVETATFAALLSGYVFIGFCDFYPILFQQGRLMFFLTAALFIANTKKLWQNHMQHDFSKQNCLENV